MGFLPKSYERYSAAIRSYLQNRYFRNGEKNFPLTILKRVLVFEIFTTEKQSESTAMASFCDNVISSAQIELMKKGYFFECTIKGDAILNIDRRVITAILCECSLSCAMNKSALVIKIDSDRLCLLFHGKKPTSTFSKLLFYINAVQFYITEQQTNAIFINLEKSNSSPLPHKAIWQYITDPMSPIKAYLEQ